MMRGDRIVERRKVLDLSQEQLADMVKTDQKAIWSYENNKREPKVEVLAMLATALETTADYLLGRTDNPSPYFEKDPDGLDPIERAAIDARRQGKFAEAARLILSQ